MTDAIPTEHQYASSINRVAPADLDAILTCPKRNVWLRFRNRGTEMVFAEVLTTPREGRCSVAPWGCVGTVFWFDVKELRGIGVPVGFTHQRFAQVCAEQRRLRDEGRFG